MRDRLKLLQALCSASIGLLLNAYAQAAVIEQEINIPITVKSLFFDSHQNMVGTEYRPEGKGPFPLLLINHGTPRSPADNGRMTDGYKAQARLFAQRGFVVINPLRRGFGKSDGVPTDNYSNCTNPTYYEAGLETAKDINAVVKYAAGKPYIDAARIVLLGKSGGGFGVLALSSQNPPGVIGVINFAGGRGSRRPDEVCNENKLVDAFSRYAKTTHVPMLWFYAENDHFFGPALAKRLVAAYQDQGVDLRFVAEPPYGKDGHNFFNGIENAPRWMSEVEPFLKKIGLTDRLQKTTHDADQASK